MNLNAITKSIFEKKKVDYMFIIFFLLIFSIFIVFAIKPSLTTAYSLKKEEMDLTKIDQVYEEKISGITAIQTQIEDNRDSIPLLDQAVSVQPEVNKVIEDIKTIADKNSIIINKANIVNINFSQTNKEKQNIELKMEATSDFKNLKSFIADIFAQRRLKVITNLEVSREKEASGSGNLNIVININGYYL